MKIRTMFVALFNLLALVGFAYSLFFFPWISVVPAAIVVWTASILVKRRPNVNWPRLWSIMAMIIAILATIIVAILFGWWALVTVGCFFAALIWFLRIIGKSTAVAAIALVIVIILFGVFCLLSSIGVLNVDQLNVGSINTDELNATKVDTTEVNATKVNATEVNATKVDTTEVNATKVNATEVNATKVNASEVNATNVNATEVNATKVNATEVNATKVNTTEVNATEVKSNSGATTQATQPSNKPATQATKPSNKPATQKPTTQPTQKPTAQPTQKPTTQPTQKPTTQVKNPSISVSTDYMQKGDTVIVTLKDATASDVVIKYVNPNNGSWVYGGATLKSIGNNQYRLVVDNDLFEMAVDLTLGISGQSNYKMVTLEPCYE